MGQNSTPDDFLFKIGRYCDDIVSKAAVLGFKLIPAVLLALLIGLPGQSRAQTPAPITVPQAQPLTPPPTATPSTQATTPSMRASAPPASDVAMPTTAEVGNVASVSGAATVTRNGQSIGLKVKDPIFNGDVLRTGASAALGVIFDDETTFNLSANASITVNSFLYEKGGKKNASLFNITLGSIAFAAQQVAKTGDMKIATPISTLGIRGTSGVIEVPEGVRPGGTAQVAVKLYRDANGRVGRIELFGGDGSGPRLGVLTRASTGFAVRADAPQRFVAVPLRITAQQINLDRAFVQRTFAAHSSGRSMILQRQNLRIPNLQQGPGPRQPGSPGLGPPGRRSGGPQTPTLRRQGLQQQQQRTTRTQQAVSGSAAQGSPRRAAGGSRNLHRSTNVQRATSTSTPGANTSRTTPRPPQSRPKVPEIRRPDIRIPTFR